MSALTAARTPLRGRSFARGSATCSRPEPSARCRKAQLDECRVARNMLRLSRRGLRKRMFAVLGLGFLLGMQHALEADHIAAVSSIAARRSDFRDIVKHG